jgi:hypothetical protein
MRGIAGAFSVYFKETFIDGPFEGSQFGQNPAVFKTNGSEFVRSIGWTVTIDLSHVRSHWR